jgi:hypothetical protein
MLFKNGKLVDLRGDSDEAKEYRKQMEWVKENLGFPVVFKRSSSYITPDERSDGKMFMRTPAFFIPNLAEVNTEYGTDEWRWSPRIPRMRDGEYVFNKEISRTMLDREVFSLDEKYMDKIYFYLYLDTQFKKYYHVDDEKAKANERVNNKIKDAKIYNAFYGEKSVLLKDEQKLRTIAMAWNIRDIKNKTKNQVLEYLEAAVREQDAKGIRSVDDFLKATQLGQDTEVSAMIQKAEDLKVIRYDKESSTWFYLNFNGENGDKICEVPKNQREHTYEILKDYVFVEKDHITKIKSLVNATNVDDELRLNFDDLENEDYNEKIRPYCSLHDIKPTAAGRTKAMVFKDIRKHAGKE